MEKQQRVEALIVERIRSGNWKMHEKLPPERQLAQVLGVSRNTLRTALQVLQGKGILGSRRGSGTFVQAVPGEAARGTRQELRARLAALALFFPPVAARCALEARPAEVLELEALLSQVGLAVHTGSAADFARAQRVFLRAVSESAHNAQVAAAMGHVIPHGRFFSEAVGHATKTECELIFAQLAGLLGGIRRGVPEEARLAALQYAEILAECNAKSL